MVVTLFRLLLDGIAYLAALAALLTFFQLGKSPGIELIFIFSVCSVVIAKLLSLPLVHIEKQHDERYLATLSPRDRAHVMEERHRAYEAYQRQSENEREAAAQKREQDRLAADRARSESDERQRVADAQLRAEQARYDFESRGP